MKNFLFLIAALFCLNLQNAFAQIPVSTLVKIVRAEDERRYDDALELLLKNPNAAIRTRAALAAGRIGDEKSVRALLDLFKTDSSDEVRRTALFAVGEIESPQASTALIEILNSRPLPKEIRARAIEAAGKIAAANPKDAAAKLLSETILNTLVFENKTRDAIAREIALPAITALLRARPEGADKVLTDFLGYSDARIRADALNALARLRAKNANPEARNLLKNDADAIVRANAARLLGAAEDKSALDLLLNAATKDADSRVRVSAIRSLGILGDEKIGHQLITRMRRLIIDYAEVYRKSFKNPSQKNELLEIITGSGKLYSNTDNEDAVKMLSTFRAFDKYQSPETEIAFAKIAPKIYVDSASFQVPRSGGLLIGLEGLGAINYLVENSGGLGNFAQGLSQIADDKTAAAATLAKARENINIIARALPAAIILLNPQALAAADRDSGNQSTRANQSNLKRETENFESLKRNFINAFPEVLRAFAKLKPKNYESYLAEFLLNKPVAIGTRPDGKKVAVTYAATNNYLKEMPFNLLHQDAVVRATAAELIVELKELDSAPALADAFDYAMENDRDTNDAQLAILDAIVKQNKTAAAKKVLTRALNAPDYLVRQRAASLIKENDLAKDFPSVETRIDTLKPYEAKIGTKLGQILNTEADYTRAVSRKNGSVKAILTTEKGAFTIEFFPEDAPLTVDNFVKLARSNYFDGLEIHRVVPNFVMQDGDPRGDGNGGPGWQIRDEINMREYERGAVGMALSGKDTGGSQWFVTHSPQPHLDGGYTVFGRVNESDMKLVVDSIVRGDKILSVKIIEGKLAAPAPAAARRKVKRGK